MHRVSQGCRTDTPVGGFDGVLRAPDLGERSEGCVWTTPVDELRADTGDDEVPIPVGHPVDPRHEAAGRQAAQVVVSLDQHGVGPEAAGRDGGGGAGWPASDDQHVAGAVDGGGSGRLLDRRTSLRLHDPLLSDVGNRVRVCPIRTCAPLPAIACPLLRCGVRARSACADQPWLMLVSRCDSCANPRLRSSRRLVDQRARGVAVAPGLLCCGQQTTGHDSLEGHATGVGVGDRFGQQVERVVVSSERQRQLPQRPRHETEAGRARRRDAELAAERAELVEQFLAAVGQAECGRHLGLRLHNGEPEVALRHVALFGEGCCGIVDIAGHQVRQREQRRAMRACGPSSIVERPVRNDTSVPDW